MRVRPGLFLSIGLAVLAVHTVALAQSSGDAKQPARTLIRAGHLLDVHSGKVLDEQTIVVTGDEIAAVAPSASILAMTGDKVIDLGSLTVLPE